MGLRAIATSATAHARPALLQWLDRTTLRQQINWVAGALCLALVTGMTAGSTVLSRDHAYRDAEHALQSTARLFADQLDLHMADRLREVRHLAELAPLQSLWHAAPEAVREVMDHLRRSRPSFAWIGFAAPHGRISVATGRHVEGHDVSDRRWFANGAQGPTAGDVYEAHLLGELLGTSPTGAPSQFIDVSVPVLDGRGQVSGILGAHLSWTSIGELRDGLLASRRAEHRERILVLDRGGRVILGGELGSLPFGVDQSDGGSVVRQAPDGVMLASFADTRGRADFSGLGWTVVVERPLDAALAPANRLNALLAGLGVTVAVLGLAAFAAFARRVSRPIGELTDAIGQIGRDPQARMIKRLHGSSEIADLSAAMRSLLRRVGTAQDQIKRAEERSVRLDADLNAIQRLADTDALTGLFNRRAFIPFAQEALASLSRDGRPFGVLMVDIDHFKRINDTNGHAVGDDVIRAVGASLSDVVRGTDRTARFGGEEFVVLLRDADLAQAEALAQRLCDHIRALTIGEVACTVSIGVAAGRVSDVDVEKTIERADRALYRAKSEGRDRVCVEDAAEDSDALRAA